MACRKVLMNVAVDRGADGNLRFVEYVDWFETNHYIPPHGREWIERIKDIGNEAHHDIPDIDHERARETLRFTEWMLHYIYEMPGLAQN